MDRMRVHPIAGASISVTYWMIVLLLPPAGSQPPPPPPQPPAPPSVLVTHAAAPMQPPPPQSIAKQSGGLFGLSLPAPLGQLPQVLAPPPPGADEGEYLVRHCRDLELCNKREQAQLTDESTPQPTQCAVLT